MNSRMYGREDGSHKEIPVLKPIRAATPSLIERGPDSCRVLLLRYCILEGQRLFPSDYLHYHASVRLAMRIARERAFFFF
jgi:hypothetical protein